MQKRGLGRGLESLIPGLGQNSEAPLILGEDSEAQLQHIQVTKIVPNPNQPRKQFDEDAFSELVSSIKEHGLVQPVVVRRAGTLFELIAGERRWRAAKEAGLKTVPAIIRDATDRETLEIALIENLQRQNLNALEEAAAYYHLIEDFDLTQEEVGKRVGKNRSTIANAIRLLQLPDAVKQLIFEGKLSSGHGKTILGLESEELQIKLAERVIKDGLTVRQVEALVRLWSDPSQKTKPRYIPLHYKKAARKLSGKFSTKVKIKPQGEKGKVEIHFESDEELKRIFTMLTGEEIDTSIL